MKKLLKFERRAENNGSFEILALPESLCVIAGSRWPMFCKYFSDHRRVVDFANSYYSRQAFDIYQKDFRYSYRVRTFSKRAVGKTTASRARKKRSRSLAKSSFDANSRLHLA